MRIRRKFLLAWIAIVTLLSYWYVQKMGADGWNLLFYPPYGTVVGEFEGESIYAAGSPSVRGRFGLEFQCVELVNRFYAKRLEYRNLSGTGDADSYFWNAATKGLKAYENGGPEPPQKYDLLIFDGGNGDGDPGHVALIIEVDLNSQIVFVQQNSRKGTLGGLFVQFNWRDSLHLDQTAEGGWHVEQDHYPQPVAGWSRRLEARQ